MALNEQTHHLFLTYHAYYASPGPFDNIMQVLDTRTLGKGHLDDGRFGTGRACRARRRDVCGEQCRKQPGCLPGLPAGCAAGPNANLDAYALSDYSATANVYTHARLAAAPAVTPAPPLPTVGSLASCRVPDAAWLQQWFARDATLRSLRASLGCPVAPPRAVQLAVQPFTNGFMFWRADTHRITVASSNFTWTEYDDTWDASQPEGGTERPPAAGQMAPKRGFGKVWREKLGGPAAAVGWATQEERSVASEIQDFPAVTAYKELGVGNGLFFRDGTWK